MSFKGYSLFEDVANPTIKTWNICNTILNIKETHGVDIQREYIQQFDRGERIKIIMMFSYIKANGYEEVRREIFRGHEPELIA